MRQFAATEEDADHVLLQIVVGINHIQLQLVLWELLKLLQWEDEPTKHLQLQGQIYELASVKFGIYNKTFLFEIQYPIKWIKARYI